MPDTQSYVITEIAYPSVHAWEWIVDDPHFGPIKHQIVWIHGTPSLFFGTQLPGQRWHETAIVNPKRFGLKGTLTSARAAAHNFIFDREPGEGPGEMD